MTAYNPKSSISTVPFGLTVSSSEWLPQSARNSFVKTFVPTRKDNWMTELRTRTKKLEDRGSNSDEDYMNSYKKYLAPA